MLRFAAAVAVAMIGVGVVVALGSAAGAEVADAKVRTIYYEGTVKDAPESHVLLGIRRKIRSHRRPKNVRAILNVTGIPEVCTDGSEVLTGEQIHAPFRAKRRFRDLDRYQSPDSGDVFHAAAKGRLLKSRARGWVWTMVDRYLQGEPDCWSPDRLKWTAKRIPPPPPDEVPFALAGGRT